MQAAALYTQGAACFRPSARPTPAGRAGRGLSGRVPASRNPGAGEGAGCVACKARLQHRRRPGGRERARPRPARLRTPAGEWQRPTKPTHTAPPAGRDAGRRPQHSRRRGRLAAVQWDPATEALTAERSLLINKEASWVLPCRRNLLCCPPDAVRCRHRPDARRRGAGVLRYPVVLRARRTCLRPRRVAPAALSAAFTKHPPLNRCTCEIAPRVPPQVVLFLFQLEMDSQLQRALTYEAFDAAQEVRGGAAAAGVHGTSCCACRWCRRPCAQLPSCCNNVVLHACRSLYVPPPPLLRRCGRGGSRWMPRCGSCRWGVRLGQ